ncbi:hypothetical protein A1Q1_04693 [Trichosporon asahii var. asahii CBS 2479]|uniref:Uncharacterized protein n=1 Tax=Trichosporon asahii var. asahii (strain ATCC 90039 / CBS 2479 / JCM 2466 / KCTC 7840 / NBRC 103889/ NCYC 2677 / UAMH 7654) TaxID=1186058 RepID=J5QD06_TRIAS|nr:hypothetical protein A1Q1_04693 [Trichosporon asahii var. asahii CBS 2479]EJT46728.1 hypothetical protein A1Q1_04693 [Trichosporon asahii var. asahii CBS 2479]
MPPPSTTYVDSKGVTIDLSNDQRLIDAAGIEKHIHNNLNSIRARILSKLFKGTAEEKGINVYLAEGDNQLREV